MNTFLHATLRVADLIVLYKLLTSVDEIDIILRGNNLGEFCFLYYRLQGCKYINTDKVDCCFNQCDDCRN